MAAAPPDPGLAQRLPGADDRVFAFITAWCAMRHGALVPRRRDFDPSRIAPMLPHVWIYRDDPDIGDFVCTLAGEEINTAWGASIKGRTLREIVGEDDHRVVLPRWRQVVGVPLIHYGAASERMSSIDARRVERVVLPLRSDGETPDHVVGLSLYAIGSVDLSRASLIPNDVIQIPCTEI